MESMRLLLDIGAEADLSLNPESTMFSSTMYRLIVELRVVRHLHSIHHRSLT